LPSYNYMSLRQPYVDIKMRSILFDWMMEVCCEYKLQRETCYTALNYVDRFLSKITITRNKLQLVGATALFIASKFEEIYAPRVQDFVWVTDNTYTCDEFFEMEKLMLATLNWRLRPLTVHYFIKYYLHLFLQKFKNINYINATPTTILEQFPKEIFFRCMEIIDLATLDYNVLKFLPSKISASILYLLEHTAGFSPSILNNIDNQIKEITGYEVIELKETTQWTQMFMRAPMMSTDDRTTQLMQSSSSELQMKSLHPTDILSIQSHNQNALSCFENILLEQNG